MTKSIYEEWLDGEQPDMIVINALFAELGEVESELMMATAELSAQRMHLRNQLGHVLAKYGQDVTVPGVGKLQITSPSSGHTYKAKEIDSIVRQLRDAGHGPIADLIEEAKDPVSRAGGLRVTFEKKRK